MDRNDIMLIEYTKNIGSGIGKIPMVAIFNKSKISEHDVRIIIKFDYYNENVIKVEKQEYENVFGKIGEQVQEFVVQQIFDCSYVRAIMNNNRTDERSLSFTNRIQYAMTFTSKEDEMYKEIIDLLGEEGYDYQLINI
jgi:hypothetical protein